MSDHVDWLVTEIELLEQVGPVGAVTVLQHIKPKPLQRHCLDCGGQIKLSDGCWIHTDRRDVQFVHLAKAGCEDCGAPEPLSPYHQCPPDWTI